MVGAFLLWAVVAPGATDAPWPAVEFGAGPMVQARDAEITADGVEPPVFDSGFTLGFAAAARVFPFALIDAPRLVSAIGVFGELAYRPIDVEVQPFDAGDAVDSYVLRANGGACYRVTFDAGDLTPMAMVKLGVDHYRAPLSAGAFPGVSYTSVVVAAGGGMVWRDWGGASAELRVLPAVGHGQDVGTLGRRGDAFGWGWELAAWATWAERVRFELGVSQARYGLSFSGPTNLRDSIAQYQDVELDDRATHWFISAGLAL